MRRRVAGLVAGTLSLSLFACEAEQKEKPQAEAARPASTTEAKLTGTRVEVAIVQPSSRSLEVTVPGEVEGYRDADLASPLGGYVESVKAKEGDRVKAGQVLALIDSLTHGARRGRAKVEMAAATRELDRAKSLGTSIPQVEVDAAQDRVATAEAALRELNVNVARAVVKAPFAGVVVDRDVEVGEVAAPGAPLFRIVQLSPIKISVSLSDRDVALAQPGTRARVQLDARSGIFEGEVVYLSQAAAVKTRAFKAWVQMENDDEALLPGMIARVTLSSSPSTPNTPTEKAGAADKSAGTQGGETEGASSAVAASGDRLIISQDWLVTKPDGVGVFIERGGKAEWRPVVLGEVLRKQVVVQSGLNAGDALIIVGHRELAQGDEVLVHRRGKCCTGGRAVF